MYPRLLKSRLGFVQLCASTASTEGDFPKNPIDTFFMLVDNVCSYAVVQSHDLRIVSRQLSPDRNSRMVSRELRPGRDWRVVSRELPPGSISRMVSRELSPDRNSRLISRELRPDRHLLVISHELPPGSDLRMVSRPFPPDRFPGWTFSSKVSEAMSVVHASVVCHFL